MFENAKSAVLCGGDPSRAGDDTRDGLTVATVLVEDCDYYGYVTYLEDEFDEYAVAKYDSIDEAAEGHAHWVKNISNPKFKKIHALSLWDSDGYGKVRIWRRGHKLTLNEVIRRRKAEESAERKRKLENKRSVMKTYRPVVAAFKGFPFKKIAESHGRLGRVNYCESCDYMAVTSKEDGGFKKTYIPHRRYSYFSIAIYDPKIITKYEEKFMMINNWLYNIKYNATDMHEYALYFEVTVDPWTTQKWLKECGSDYKLDRAWVNRSIYISSNQIPAREGYNVHRTKRRSAADYLRRLQEIVERGKTRLYYY